LGSAKGKRVLIIGSGISGLLHVKTAKYSKAKSIVATDIDLYRLKQAKKFGANFTINAKEDVSKKVKKYFKGKLADLVILCAGSTTAIKQGLDSVERGGTVLVFTAAARGAGFPRSINEMFWRNELTVLSSYAASGPDLKQAIDLIAKKKIVVSDMITHKFSLKDTKKGFGLVLKPNKSMKIIIKP